MFLPGGGAADYPPARALDKSELPGIAEDYAHAARNAIAAGVRCGAGAGLVMLYWCVQVQAESRVHAAYLAHKVPGPALTGRGP